MWGTGLNLYPPTIQHMKDMSADDDEFYARLITFAARLEEEQRRIYHRLEQGTMHMMFCDGDQSQRVGAEGTNCTCPTGQDLQRFRRLIISLSLEANTIRGIVDASEFRP